MATYKVEMPLTVKVVMDEMDSGAEASAEIAMDIVEEQIRAWDGNAEIEFGFVKVEEA